MNSAELFALMSPALAAEVIDFNHSHEKGVYRAALEAIAQTRKVRPVFLERMPRVEQHSLLASCLVRPSFVAAADALLRAWLLKKHNAVLMDFLDSLAIKHEQGVVEDLPKTVEDMALKNAIESLLSKHPREVVAVYLTAFNSMNIENWANLDAMLRDDARLHLTRDA